jgi:hypothetical protein
MGLSSASINVKSGFSDLVDFATNRTVRLEVSSFKDPDL